MNIKGLRTLNLLGTILFCLIGNLLAFVYYYNSFVTYRVFGEDVTICTILYLIWVCIILAFTVLFYKYTVLGLDNEEYQMAKRWTLVGVIVGFIGGIIPLIIFILSYASFDDAIRSQEMDQRYFYYPQQIGHFRYCNNCRRQIPFDSKLCPYCGVQQMPSPSYNRPQYFPPR